MGSALEAIAHTLVYDPTSSEAPHSQGSTRELTSWAAAACRQWRSVAAQDLAPMQTELFED